MAIDRDPYDGLLPSEDGEFPPLDPAQISRLMAVQAVIGEPDAAELRAIVAELTPGELRAFLADLHSRPLDRAVALARCVLAFPGAR